MVKKENPRLYQAGVVLLILLTVVPAVWYYNINQAYWWDEAVYLGLARNIYEGNGYYINEVGQETFRPPFFAYMTATIWSFTGINEEVVKIVPPLFGVLSVFLLFFFSRKLFGKEVSLWASLILASSHLFLFYSQKFLTETIFIFFALVALWAYYEGMESKHHWLLPIAALFATAAFTTRYLGFIIFIVYLAYPLVTRMPKHIPTVKKLLTNIFITNKYFWISLLIPVVLLIPWFQLNIVTYGSPLGGMFTGASTVAGGYYLGEWHYYFVHWTSIFGLIGIFALPGFIEILLKHRKENTLILLFFVISILVFIFIPRKESRYLLHFFHIYVLMLSIGLVSFRKWIKSTRLVPIVAIIFILLNAVGGYQMLEGDTTAGTALKQSGIFLAENKIDGTTIMTQNMPVLFYLSGQTIVYFPNNKEEFDSYAADNKVSYVVIEAREPTYPDWVFEITEDWVVQPTSFWDDYELVGSFDEREVTIAWIYKL